MIRRIAILSAAIAVAAIFMSALGATPYPWKGTALFAGAVLLEAALVWRVLRPENRRHRGRRAMVSAALCLGFLWFAAQDTLGAPEYVFMHQRWLVWLILSCLVLAVAGGITRLRRPQE